jgi:zinc protease
LIKTLEDLKTNPITEAEMNRSKANLSKQFDQIFRNSSYLGLYMSEYIGAGDWRLAFITRDRIENTELEAVNTAATTYLIPSNRTIGRFNPTKSPERVTIPHTENLEALVSTYKGRQDLGTGESFDVSYENIQSRLEQGKLSNGISYGFIEKSNRGNNVVLSFSMRNGNVNSLMNKGVIPEYTADMLSMGTTKHSRQELEDALTALKSSIYFRGSNGNVYANISSTKENLIPTLELMAEMIKYPSFDAAELETLKTEALADIEASKSEPQAIAINRISEINNTYPKGHPNYSMGMEEEAEAIRALSTEDLKAFHNDFYGLGMSITVGVGTFDGDAVKSFMEKEFAGFESNNPYARIESPFVDNKVHHENIITPDKQNAMSFGIQGIKISEYSEDYPAMEMAATILGGGFLNSRIADRLRQKDGVSYGAGAGFGADSSKEDENSQLYVYAIYNPANLAKVKLGFEEEIQRFIDGGITEEELENAKNGWIQGQSVSRAKDNELSSLINNNIFYNRDMSYHQEMEERVNRLTVADVNAAIVKYIKPFAQWTVVHAGDFKE